MLGLLVAQPAPHLSLPSPPARGPLRTGLLWRLHARAPAAHSMAQLGAMALIGLPRVRPMHPLSPFLWQPRPARQPPALPSFPTSPVMACLPSEAATPAEPRQAWQASKIARITLLAIYHTLPTYKTLSRTPPSLLFLSALELSPLPCYPPL